MLHTAQWRYSARRKEGNVPPNRSVRRDSAPAARPRCRRPSNISRGLSTGTRLVANSLSSVKTLYCSLGHPLNSGRVAQTACAYKRTAAVMDKCR